MKHTGEKRTHSCILPQLRAAPLLPEEETSLKQRLSLHNKAVELSSLQGDQVIQDIEEQKQQQQQLVSSTGEPSITGNILETLRGDAPPLSIFLLNLVAIIWGTQHAVIKMVMDDSQAAPFTLLRFAIAAVIASPYTPSIKTLKSETQVKNAWRWGAEMGLWMFLGFSFQAVGLAFTTAQRSGFLIYLNVKLVPFFAKVLFGRPISVPTWISAAAAFFGTVLLALDGQSIGFNVGDAWTIAAAASSAMFILRLESATQEVEDSAALNSACLWTVLVLSVLWTFFDGKGIDTFATSNILDSVNDITRIASSHLLELLYLGGVTTALSNFIQTKAQKDVSAERASVIYSLDPVYGAFFSYWLLGEQLGGVQAYSGAALITVAAATNVFLDFGQKNISSKKKVKP